VVWVLQLRVGKHCVAWHSVRCSMCCSVYSWRGCSWIQKQALEKQHAG
jgi:hypothetical protein